MNRLVLAAVVFLSAVPAYADSIPINISFSAPVAPQPFTNPKDFFQLPAGARNVSLNITTFSVDDRGVLLLNDSIIASTGIGGPGWGEMALTSDGPSLPFNFEYGNNNAPFSILNLFVTGWNELSLIVNNTGQGINDGLSSIGSSSATLIGTVTFDVGPVPVPPPRREVPLPSGFMQQGPKLVASDVVGAAGQGNSAALSADGNTAIIGGPHDNDLVGAAWVYTRSNGVWTQQGSKLVGSGAIGSASQGVSVSLSADGNTAIIGGSWDSANLGAAWVFTRSNGVWTEQSKLVGTGAVGNAAQGASVSLSADGNTALVGGPGDNSNAGAVWAFIRSNGVWTQQGNKLVGTGAVSLNGHNAFQGSAVALSGDGNTAIVGGRYDNGWAGAAWVFTRSNGVWAQQGNKLVGSNGGAYAKQGFSVALSGDGNTGIVGGPGDESETNYDNGSAWVFTRSNGLWTQQGQKLVGSPDGPFMLGSSVALSADGNTAVAGAPQPTANCTAGYLLCQRIGSAWIFTRSNGVWTQQGSKLVGSGATISPDLNAFVLQGDSVALSADAKTVIVGGPGDNVTTDNPRWGTGAAWVFTQNIANTHNFDGDSFSDIAWRQNTGTTAVWLMNGAQIAQAGSFGLIPTTWQIVGQRDFDGGGKSDLLWRNANGEVAIWTMNGIQGPVSTGIATVPTSWSIAGTGDFNRDNKGDILWRDINGNVAIWMMNGPAVSSSALVGNVPPSWSIAGTSGNQIIWRDTGGNLGLWTMNGGSVASTSFLGNVPINWSIAGTGDFNGDSNPDILWRDDAGNVAILLMGNNGTVSSSVFVGNVPSSWSIAETGDFDGDGKSDILWRDTSGNIAIWFMNGGAVASASLVGNVPISWSIQGMNAD